MVLEEVLVCVVVLMVKTVSEDAEEGSDGDYDTSNNYNNVASTVNDCESNYSNSDLIGC